MSKFTSILVVLIGVFSIYTLPFFQVKTPLGYKQVIVPPYEYESAKATWYSLPKRFTASGERHNPNAMTVAHKTLPFHTIVEMCNPINGRAIKVRVNDRGPYDKNVPAKKFDLSPRAFQALGVSLAQGVVDIHWRVVPAN